MAKFRLHIERKYHTFQDPLWWKRCVTRRRHSTVSHLGSESNRNYESMTNPQITGFKSEGIILILMQNINSHSTINPCSPALLANRTRTNARVRKCLLLIHGSKVAGSLSESIIHFLTLTLEFHLHTIGLPRVSSTQLGFRQWRMRSVEFKKSSIIGIIRFIIISEFIILTTPEFDRLRGLGSL